jgi:hypothetical protein
MLSAMRLTLARFEDGATARACLRELRRGQLWRTAMRVIVRSGDQTLAFDGQRSSRLRGILMGASVGIAAGLTISLVEAKARGIEPVFVVAFCVFGIVLGAFAGALVAPLEPDPSLDSLADGSAVVAVESPREADVDFAALVFRKFGAVPDKRIITTSSARRRRAPA